MSNPLPDAWFSAPPRSLVAGDGPYAQSLAQLLGADFILLDQFNGGPDALENGALPELLDGLETVFLVIPEALPLPQVLWHHHWIWQWALSLARARNYHQLAIVFVLGKDDTEAFATGLANGLGLDRLDPSQGFMLWRRSEPLRLLLNQLPDLATTDAQTVMDAQNSLPKRRALVQLKQVIALGSPDQIADSARHVSVEFQDDLPALDNYCQPPCHPNGNAWRSWLKTVVTEGVTPDSQINAQRLLPTLIV
jgi:hypothetical protein